MEHCTLGCFARALSFSVAHFPLRRARLISYYFIALGQVRVKWVLAGETPEY
jgi:hypothetical protein